MPDEISTHDHHYIPKFYLKGFTDDRGMLYVYDKQSGRIRSTAPAGAFYEKHGNTGFIQHPETGEKHWTDLAEHLMARLDSSLADCLQIIKETDATINAMASPLVVEAVKQLIHFLFWRTPVNKARLDELLATMSFSDLGFGIFDENGKRFINTEKLMTTIDLWRKCSPALIATARSFSTYKENNISDWGIYYQAKNHYLVTDSPILLKSYSGPGSLERGLLFPLTGNMLAIACGGKKKERVDPMYREQLDIVLFQQADRYVGSSKREYLLHIIDKVRYYSEDGEGWEAKLREHVLQAYLAGE